MEKDVTVIIANWAGVNLGDDAIFYSLLSLVKENIPQKVKFYVLADNDKLLKSNYDIEDSIRIFEFFKRFNLLKTAYFLWKSDAVIYGGGDLVNGDIRSMSFIFLAKMLGLPVIYCGVGVLPIKSKLERAITTFVSNKVDLITVRDENSKNLLISMGITKPPIHITADPAYTLKDSGKKLDIVRDKSKKIIGVNLRSIDELYKFYSSKSIDNKVMADIFDKIIEKFDSELIFIPMITNYRAKFYHSYLKTDEDILKDILNLMKNKDKVIMLTEEYRPNEMAGILKQLDVLIAMRLHALLIASNMGTPTIAINYAPKIVNLLSDNGYIVPIEKLNLEDFLMIFQKRLYDNNISGKIKVSRMKSRKNIDYILKILNQKSKNYYKFYLFLIPSLITIFFLNYSIILKFIIISLVKKIKLYTTALTINR